MSEQQKITAILPAKLLQRARRATGQGITPTLRQGLELLAAGAAYERLRRARGKVRFSVNLRALRADRT